MQINARTYTTDRVTPDAIAYVGPGHTLTFTDKVDLKRAYPKPSGDFKGVSKASSKITRTVVTNATTGATATAILEISSSFPIGMSATDQDAMLADAGSFVDSVDSKNLHKLLDINAG
jgi:phenylacetate-coenzyme A ligase PaaK-like adenylate-forming protein